MQPLSTFVATGLTLFFVFMMSASPLLAVALGALCGIVYCFLAAHFVVNSALVLPFWLVLVALFQVCCAVGVALIVQTLDGVGMSEAATAGAAASCGAALFAFRHRDICGAMLRLCCLRRAVADGEPTARDVSLPAATVIV